MGIIKPNQALFHETYAGDRYRYGFRSRPPGYATCPDGFIIGSQGYFDVYAHGTIDYPRMLTWEEVNRYSLVLDGMWLTKASVNWFIDEAHGHWHLHRQVSNTYLNWWQLKADGAEGNSYLLVIPDKPDAADKLFPVVVIPQIVL